MNSLNGLKHEKGQNKNKNFRHSTTLTDHWSLAEKYTGQQLGSPEEKGIPLLRSPASL